MRTVSPLRPRLVALPDGRRLAYTAVGPVDGVPVVYCHGAIGAPIACSPELRSVVEQLGVRYLMVSRPGFGRSDPQAGRTIAGFGRDLRDLADTLGLERLALVGVSAGGPYALAAARELGERASAVALCSSISPLCPPHATPGIARRFRLPLMLLARAPNRCAVVGDALVPLVQRHPGLLLAVMRANASEADRAPLREGPERQAAVDSFRLATAGGVRGMIDDYLLCARPWGFDPAEVPAEVHLWHGLADVLVPVEHALQLAVALPRCRAFFHAEEGHFFFRRRLSEILGVLTGRGGAQVAPADLASGGDARVIPLTWRDGAPRERAPRDGAPRGGAAGAGAPGRRERGRRSTRRAAASAG
jgi:pimeloyl-ACP methyl ester carboxylesterase